MSLAIVAASRTRLVRLPSPVIRAAARHGLPIAPAAVSYCTCPDAELSDAPEDPHQTRPFGRSCIVPLDLMILASTVAVPFPGYLLASCRPKLLLRPDRRVLRWPAPLQGEATAQL